MTPDLVIAMRPQGNEAMPICALTGLTSSVATARSREISFVVARRFLGSMSLTAVASTPLRFRTVGMTTIAGWLVSQRFAHAPWISSP